MRPTTIEAYLRAIWRIGDYFDHPINQLTEAQFTDYFSDLVALCLRNTVKFDRYGLRFYTKYVLKKPWVAPGLIKLPKTQQLSGIINVDDVP